MGIIGNMKDNEMMAQKAAAYDKLQNDYVRDMDRKEAYDRGAVETEASLAEMLYRAQRDPNYIPEGATSDRVDYNIQPMQSDAPVGVENIPYGLAQQRGLVR